MEENTIAILDNREATKDKLKELHDLVQSMEEHSKQEHPDAEMFERARSLHREITSLQSQEKVLREKFLKIQHEGESRRSRESQVMEDLRKQIQEKQ